MPQGKLGRFAAILKDWGARLLSPEDDPQGERYVQVLLPVGGERVPIGRLWIDDGEFLFAYDPAFRDRDDIPPISAFPDRGGTYRLPVLFPFFKVRIPPTERADVKRVLDERGIDEKDTLRVLAELGGRIATSPYVLVLCEDQPPIGHQNERVSAYPA